MITNFSRTVRKSNVCMCRRDCEPALRHSWMVHIPFAENRNLSVFCANTKRTGCTGCPFHAPGVLCSPQVLKKLINRAPLTRRKRTAQRVSGALMYTKLYIFFLILSNFLKVLTKAKKQNFSRILKISLNILQNFIKIIPLFFDNVLSKNF